MKNKTYYEKKLDLAWGHKGKEEAMCEICQTLPIYERINYTQLHPHHIIGRKNKATRWDLRNRLWVCPYHHTFGGASETVQDNLGGWFLNWESDKDWMGQHRKKDKEHLRQLHNSIKHYTLGELEEMLKSMS